MKLLLIGHSGSGKSTFARRAGEGLGVPVLHLDQVFWEPGWIHRDREEAWRAVDEFLDQNPAWVIDGNWSDQRRRLEEADLIVFFDFPRRTCLRHVFKRWLAWRGTARPDMREGCPERVDLSFVGWILWGGRTRAKRNGYRAIQRDYVGKVCTVRTEAQVEELAHRLGV